MQEKDTIYGIRTVIEAVESGKDIDKVLIKPGLQGELFNELMATLKTHKINWQKVPQEKLFKLAGKNHQGVVALVSPLSYTDLEPVVEAALAEGRTPLILILDGITDVRNLGAIARSAECAGVDALVLPEKGSAPINADAIKTSAGALFNLPVCRVPKIWYSLKYLKEKGFTIYGASEKSETAYYKGDYRGPVALVMGAEDKGISSQVHKMVDTFVALPVKGEIASLNVSVAAGVLVYEILRQRESKIS